MQVDNTLPENIHIPKGPGGDIVLKTARIMVVDDNDINRKVAIFSLKKYFVLSPETSKGIMFAVDGCEAVEKYKESAERGERLQLIFMDCNMPNMSGYEATQKIREMEEGLKKSNRNSKESEKDKGGGGNEGEYDDNDGFRECTIIALTADGTVNPKASLDSGMNACVLKPFSKEDLALAMRKCRVDSEEVP
eukprot:Nk52_evm6s1945 gene=Nk52_evmTU6s1945